MTKSTLTSVSLIIFLYSLFSSFATAASDSTAIAPPTTLKPNSTFILTTGSGSGCCKKGSPPADVNWGAFCPQSGNLCYVQANPGLCPDNFSPTVVLHYVGNGWYKTTSQGYQDNYIMYFNMRLSSPPLTKNVSHYQINLDDFSVILQQHGNNARNATYILFDYTIYCVPNP